MKKPMRELLKEAHDHGYGIGRSNLDWTEEKSFAEFLKQNNIPMITEAQLRATNGKKAVRLKAEGHSLRDIAGILGYSNPETVRLLIKRYSKK
jgi:hypothetical protein